VGILWVGRDSAAVTILSGSPSLSFRAALLVSAPMLVEFIKMNGTGNDFILIDNRQGLLRLTPAQVRHLCHRQRGIGADGLFLLIPCSSGQAEWAWEFFNSDGSTATMCGNGARCFARFVQKVTHSADKITFETGAGLIRAHLEPGGVTVNLTDPRDLQLNIPLPLDGSPQAVHFINTGVPHVVLFVPDADQAMVQTWGPQIRHHYSFGPQGTNVNFVQICGKNTIRVRTFERGVENETLACGTGVTASALIAARLHQFSSPVQVRVQGGDQLAVSFDQHDSEFRNVRLSGPAEFVFEGRIEV